MALPIELVQQIREAGKGQGIDAEAAIEEITALVGDGGCLEFSVWAGPGWHQDKLRFDVYVLGGSCLYNYSLLESASQRAAIFLDSIHAVTLLHVQDVRSPYILAYEYGGSRNPGTIFGGPDDVGRLEQFQHKIINACTAARDLEEVINASVDA